MKKLLIFFALTTMLILPIYVYAQSREASGITISQTRTNFSNIAAMGQNVTGNPGFLVLTGVAVSDASYVPEYYFWVDATGDLCTASGPVIENQSNFPDGDWNGFSAGACTKVGGQS